MLLGYNLQQLINRLQDSKHAFAEHFGGTWPWPDQEALDTCIAKLRKSGMRLSDPASLKLPDEVSSIVANSHCRR